MYFLHLSCASSDRVVLMAQLRRQLTGTSIEVSCGGFSSKLRPDSTVNGFLILTARTSADFDLPLFLQLNNDERVLDYSLWSDLTLASFLLSPLTSGQTSGGTNA